MKTSGYMTRALRARDPRFARILGKLGYDRRDLQASDDAPERADDIAVERAEYQAVVGKKAFHGWDVETLREKIAAARQGS